MLKLSPRQVRRIKPDLDGQSISRRTFPAQRSSAVCGRPRRMPDNIEATVEQYLAALPEADWQALCARVRPPGESLRDFTADLFGIAEDTEPDEPGEPQHNIIRGEGPNPEAKPSFDEKRYARWVFDEFAPPTTTTTT